MPEVRECYFICLFTALLFGMIGNAFAAFKGSENKKLMGLPGVKDRYAGVANQSRRECEAGIRFNLIR